MAFCSSLAATGPISVSGWRRTPLSRPISASAAFTGMGLTYRNSASISG